MFIGGSGCREFRAAGNVAARYRSILFILLKSSLSHESRQLDGGRFLVDCRCCCVLCFNVESRS